MPCFWTLLAFVVAVVGATLPRHWQMGRLAAARAGENFDTFRAGIESDGIRAPESVLRAVYERLQVWLCVLDFPVRADDNIRQLYGMADEDLEDIVLEMLSDCRRGLPSDELRR